MLVGAGVNYATLLGAKKEEREKKKLGEISRLKTCKLLGGISLLFGR